MAVKIALVAVIVMACVLGFLGCKDDTAGSPPPKPMTEAQLNDRIGAIQNNPNIPAEGKEMAIRQMKAAYEMMKGQADKSAKRQSKAN